MTGKPVIYEDDDFEDFNLPEDIPLIKLFENPFRYIEIVDEKGEKVSADDLKMIEIVDRLGLWINKNDSFDVELVLIDNHTFSEIKRIPIEEIFIDYPIF